MNKNFSFKKLFFLITSIFFTISILFFAKQLFAVSNDDCIDCTNDEISYVDNDEAFTEENLENMRKLIKKNNYEYSIGKNSATEYSLSQICGLSNSSENKVSAPTNTITEDQVVEEGIPSGYDLRTYGLTPIKSQNTCGSCWAFTTAGVMENVVKLRDGKTLDLSEQWLINCNSNNYDCTGGWWAFDMYKTQGSVYEEDMPYSSSEGNCKTNLTYNEKLSNWAYIGTSSSIPSVELIKQAIKDYGPVAAGVYADSNFQAYGSGVYNGTDGEINHGIILIGWDDSKNAWILRNSWGTDWGENGYMYIDYNSSNVGEGAAYINY
ncbi:MAG: C1 family peptidase [Clostridiales bacterium]